MANVWTWGPFVDANSWRTTGDITDTWQSLYRIGFELQPELYPYAGPGHWNDPDMLVVGKVGWSNNLRDSRLTPDEQYTHITLWSLLAANMLIGCDIAQIDDFTFNLLCNNEVNAVNQDDDIMFMVRCGFCFTRQRYRRLSGRPNCCKACRN